MIKKLVQNAVSVIALTSSVISSDIAVQQFEKAWENPSYTQIQLDDIDVNKILKEHYETSQPLHFTREMLWDVERKKAWEPKIYISNVVNEGKSWDRTNLNAGDEHFTRSTQQKQWMTNNYEQVIESTFLLNKEQRAIFIGVSEARGEKGEKLISTNTQPLFYVEHGVIGAEDQPKNTWRIVHLTKEKDINLIKEFEKFDNPTRLPKYIEIYIEKDLGIKLKKK